MVTDYYRAMAEIEGRLELSEDDPIPPTHTGQLLALVDSLNSGTLNDGQRETVRSLRSAILAFAQQEAGGLLPLAVPRELAVLERHLGQSADTLRDCEKGLLFDSDLFHRVSRHSMLFDP